MRLGSAMAIGRLCQMGKLICLCEESFLFLEYQFSVLAGMLGLPGAVRLVGLMWGRLSVQVGDARLLTAASES